MPAAVDLEYGYPAADSDGRLAWKKNWVIGEQENYQYGVSVQVRTIPMIYFTVLLALSLATGRESNGQKCSVGGKPFGSVASCFHACYPSRWHVYGDASSRARALDVINFNPEKKVSGVFIPDGGAEIVVGPLPPEMTDVGRWLAVRAKGESDPSVSRVRMNDRGLGAIGEYTEARWYSEIGPGAFMTKVAAHFRVGNRWFEAELTHWKDDARSAQYTSALRQVLLSFRIPGDLSCK